MWRRSKVRDGAAVFGVIVWGCIGVRDARLRALVAGER
jgi:hypothetical protein